MKSRRKIGIVVDQMLTGGVQLAAIEQVRELRKLGHNAKLLILMRKKYPTNFSYLVEGVPHQYLSDSYPPLFRKTFKFPIFSFLSTLHLASPIFSPSVIKNDKYDILVSWGTTTCLTTQAIFRKLKTPYIAIIHDPIEYILDKVYSQTHLKYFFPVLKPLARRFESSFVKDAAQTVLISKVHLNYLKKNYKVEPEIVPLGVAPREIASKKSGFNLLSFGRWQKEKNPQFLLKILQEIPKINLIIAGSWINERELAWFRERIIKENLKNRVQIITDFREEELPDICAKAFVFVHPHFEAFGLAALEAASYSLPVIIPERSGVTENFIHGVHGFFPKKVDVGEYTKYVTRLLEDEKLATRMGRAVAKVVRNKYSWESNVEKLLSLINSALSKGRTKILVLETGHALGSPLAGGDRLMEPMASKLYDQYNFSIIVSGIGASHWLNAPFPKEISVLPKNRFDLRGSPIPLFITYCLRIWQSTKLLLRETLQSRIIYSSTNILPDVTPAFFAKLRTPGINWIARIHHLIPPPHKREGRFVVNLVSFLMQVFSLWMIKTKADVVIFLNDGLKKELTKKNFSNKKLTVLGAGIDFKKIDSQKILPGTKSYDCVFLGRLHPTKGIFDLIPIAKGVTRKMKKTKIAIIGNGLKDITEKLKSDIKKNNLSKNIFLLGFQQEKKLYSIMKKSKVFLFTDHEAGWGIAVAEAMAAGLPVVGYDIGILGTVYESGFRKVPLGDYKAYGKEIINLLENPRERIQLSKEAKSQAFKLDWAKTTQEFQNILDSING